MVEQSSVSKPPDFQRGKTYRFSKPLVADCLPVGAGEHGPWVKRVFEAGTWSTYRKVEHPSGVRYAHVFAGIPRGEEVAYYFLVSIEEADGAVLTR